MALGEFLLRPRSVAIIGASDDRSKTTARPLMFLRRSEFAGRVYPVNPRRETVLGEKAWPSLQSLPELPDHVFLLAAADAAMDSVAECVESGVPLVSMLANGFGEEGREGRAREERLRRIIDGSGTRLLGPNSIGVVNTHNGLMMTANAAFAETKIKTGGLFVASHSGSMIGAILSRGISRGFGYAGFVSTGAELDLSLGEICEAVIDDPKIDSFALFLESISHGEDLHRFALAAAARGKPVIAYKLGRSEQAAELAQSHTGAIAGEDGIADAFLKDIGIVRVETLEGLIEGPPLLRRLTHVKPTKRLPKVAVVTTTGGGGALVVDQLGLRDVEVIAPSEPTFAALASRGISVGQGRIVDLTLAGTKPDVMKAALETLLAAPEFDMVVAIAGSSARHQPELIVAPIAEAAATADKPLVAFVAPEAPVALEMLAAADVPCFRTPEACGDVVAAAFARRACKPKSVSLAEGRQLQLNEAEGYEVLSNLGVPIAEYAVVEHDADVAPTGYPVAVKLLSAEILHKTELGGVELGVANDEDFRAAVTRITSKLSHAVPEVAVDRLLVQKMVQGVGEVLLSYRRDVDAGPVVMLAAGGIFAEIYKDRSLRLAPVDKETAWSMIREVRTLKTLAGYRGRTEGDLDALADALVALSNAGPNVIEAEINPLIVGAKGQGVTAVDAVVRIIGK